MNSSSCFVFKDGDKLLSEYFILPGENVSVIGNINKKNSFSNYILEFLNKDDLFFIWQGSFKKLKKKYCVGLGIHLFILILLILFSVVLFIVGLFMFIFSFLFL